MAYNLFICHFDDDRVLKSCKTAEVLDTAVPHLSVFMVYKIND